ncbi:hypothetical protein AMTRI_Chr05g64030 [Amborella trichopoda]|uniref:Protein kinase domain-containing protein n=1 Tax=Amborella trichopoda TaxID=13333 RepID=W1NN71_AMBTC|nr:probable inactive receptor kinase At2g26730 [Amborella trichopoda]ERM97066.1 hypothetical protein AMTR_s00122p00112840 [Amborella trichopoda]|eukprot:XP_006829650.1 probable inactive receptor kinase At2g26730 [Amborella trichopoda]
MAVSLSSFSLFLLTWLCFFNGGVKSDVMASDKHALVSFISNVPHESRVEWNKTQPICSWVGITCDQNQSRIFSLRLPGVGLVGPIPANTIGRLTELRVLSLRSNRLSGEIPPDFAGLKNLRSLYLQNNEISGEIPAGFSGLNRLTHLDLSFNSLSGSIPFSLNNLTLLFALLLQNNSFSGPIPSLNLPGLNRFNLSHNRLNGSIPIILQRFPASAFEGNLELCGDPLPNPCKPFFEAPAPSPGLNPMVRKRSKRLSTAGIVLIAIAASVLLFFCLLLLLCICRKRRRVPAKTQKPSERGLPEAVASSSKDEYMSGSHEGERNKLVFFNGGLYNFDLEDLLRASAEVLGKGSVGTSYKAVLEDGTTVVVKRLKDVAVAKKEFESQMEVLGKIQHRNLLPLRAFYFSKDEKLLVYDFMVAGSLSALLHGSRGSGRTPLDWDGRMRIAMGAARGLAHLHTNARLPHGNIKSSNVLLTPTHDPCVADFGLNPLFAPSSTGAHRIAGYRAPELIETRKPSFKSDIYSFGVLLLELLTGKAPNQAALNDEGIDLPRWVQSVVREEWTAEVFDVELMRGGGGGEVEEEMVQVLQVAMACVGGVPDQRPGISEVLRMLEEVRGNDTDDVRGSSEERSKESGGHTPPEVTRVATP